MAELNLTDLERRIKNLEGRLALFLTPVQRAALTPSPTQQAPSDLNKYVTMSHDHTLGDGAPVPEDGLSINDVTTGDVSISKHGFVPKPPNDATKFLNGKALYSVPSATDPSVVWPIGSVFLSVLATDPNTLLGFGTWSQIAKGQFLVGQKDGDADFATEEGTGGSKTVNLAHTHTGASTAATPDLVAVDATATGVAEVTDSKLSATQSILPPYCVVRAWKRTA